MLTKKSIWMIVIMMPLAGLWGCALPTIYYSNNPRLLRDIQEDQPWLGADQQARAYIGYTIYSLGSSADWLEWVDADDERVALGEKVVERCRRFLERQGTWEALRGERIRIFEGTEVPRDLLIQPSRRRYSASPSIEPAKELPRLGFEEVLVIVCLDPLVVVQGPGKIQWVSPPGTADDSVSIGWEGEGKAPAHFLLPHGFDYGTEVPYSKEPIWFSPDMDAPPQRATHVDENTREIAVPWGKLVLSRDGDYWRVHARAAEGR